MQVSHLRLMSDAMQQGQLPCETFALLLTAYVFLLRLPSELLPARLNEREPSDVRCPTLWFDSAKRTASLKLKRYISRSARLTAP